MKNKNVLLSSIYTGYNYGTSLQALAMKMIIKKYGYNPEIVAYKATMSKGRDIRISKIARMFFRTIFRPRLFKKTFLTYSKSMGKSIDNQTKEKFYQFTKNHINPTLCSNSQLKKKAKDSFACVCGSAQIWNTEAVYVSPLFYLRYSPKNKRIAYAPSLGKEYVPDYNKRLLKKYINEIPYVSVRETQGAKVIKDLCSRDVTVVLDPTLLFSYEEWQQCSKKTSFEDYILIYFLDEPSENTINLINKMYPDKKKVSILYNFDIYSKLENHEHYFAGPSEFLDLIYRAEFVYTDSFHGLVFCVNFNKNFYIFDRNYGVASPQTSRITSIIDLLGIKNAYLTVDAEEYPVDWKCDYANINRILQDLREKSFEYFRNSLEGISNEPRSSGTIK